LFSNGRLLEALQRRSTFYGLDRRVHVTVAFSCSRLRRGITGAVFLLPLLGFTSSTWQRTQIPPDVRAACETAVAIAVKTPGTSVQRRDGSFVDKQLREPVLGCRIEIDGSFSKLKGSRAASEVFRDALDEGGWKELPEFSADGHDGTVFAYRKDGVACLARGAWNGGSDDEPDVPRADLYKVVVICGQAVPGFVS
jgi:hypothetical protein